MDKETHKSRRFALCAEFGAGRWRMILFFPMEEISVRSFPGAQCGKWFEQMENGEFRLVNKKNCQNMDEIEVKVDGLEKHICLKIRLPVFILPSPQTFGIVLNHAAGNKKKFVSSIDPLITGDLLFDFDVPIADSPYAALVSLTSFNVHIESGQRLKWSINSPEDILGHWDKLMLNSTSTTSSSPSGLMEKKSSLLICECPRHESKERNRRQVPEEVRHQALVICWKRTTEDSFFLQSDWDPEKSSPITRLQSNNKHLQIEMELGGWYKIEYSHFSRAGTHIFIHKIMSANGNDQEKLVKTRLRDEDIQFNLVIQRGMNGNGFESCLGPVDIPKGFGEKKGSFSAWFTLKRRLVIGRNLFEFIEESCNNDYGQGTKLTNNTEQQNHVEEIKMELQTNNTTANGGFGGGCRRQNENPISKEDIAHKYSTRPIPIPMEDKSAEGDKNVNGYEEEVAIPENMLDALLARVDCGTACQVEKCQESTNSLRIVGPSHHLVKECVQRVRALRKMMMDAEKNNPEITVKNRIKDECWQVESAEEAVESNEQKENIIDKDERNSSKSPSQQLSNIFGSSDKVLMPSCGKPTPSPSPVTAKKHEKVIHPVNASAQNSPKIHRMSVKIPKKFHGCVVGKDRTNLNWMQTKFNVNVEIPTEFSTKEEVEIRGICPDGVNKCKQHIQAMVKRIEGEKYGQISVPTRIIPLIIGSNGNKLQKLREQFPNVGIDVSPPHPQNNYVRDGFIYFQGRKEEVKKLQTHLADLIDKLKQKHHEEIIALPTDDPNHSVVEFIKFLRGKNCDRIRNLNKNFPSVKIDFPLGQNDEPLIILDGPVEEICQVKRALEKGIEELKILIDIYVAIDEKHFEKFLKMEAKLLREIKEEHPKCQIFLNKEKFQLEIRGKVVNTENARKHVMEILAKMEEIIRRISIPHNKILALIDHFPMIREKYSVKCKLQGNNPNEIQMIGQSGEELDAAERELRSLLSVTEVQEVPKEYRRKLMLNKAERMKQLEKEHNVQIIAPNAEDGQPKVKISVSGIVENVRACIVTIRREMPVIRTVKIPKEYRGAFIGKGGELVKQMEQKHSVNINFPENEDVSIVGEPRCVGKCIDEIRDKLVQIDVEKLKRNFKLSMPIQSIMRGKLIGTDGKNVLELETRFGVKIDFGVSQNSVDITGFQAECERCRAEIQFRIGQLSQRMAFNNIPNRHNMASFTTIRQPKTPSPQNARPSRSSNESGGCTLM